MTTVPTIKNVFNSGGSQLCVDSTNALWIMGDNRAHALSSEGGATITDPQPVGIKLDAGEKVRTFYVSGQLVLVHTSHRRLFINRVTKQAANKEPSVLAIHGEYFYEQTPSNRSVPNAQGMPAPDYWPAPQAITFATAYTGSSPIADTDSIDAQERELSDTALVPEVLSAPGSPMISDLDMIVEWETGGSPHIPRIFRPERHRRFGSMEADAMASHAMVQARPMEVLTREPSQTHVLLASDLDLFETDSDTGLPRLRGPHSVTSDRTQEELYVYMPSSLRTASLHSNDLPSLFNVNNRVTTQVASDVTRSAYPNERPIQGDLELEYFGIDHGTALEADGHDFGLCNQSATTLSHYYSNNILQKNITNRLSAVLADTSSFAPPLLEVDEIACADETVFFRRGDLHYVYSWILRPETAMFATTGLALTPTQHHRVLTYYQICWPFTPEVIQYCDNFVYARTGMTHHVLTAFIDKVPKPLTWIYFPFCNLDPSEIHVSLINSRLYVHQGSTVYEYLRLVQGLRPIIMDRPVTMVYADSRKLVQPYCLGPDGSLTTPLSSTHICQPDPWLRHIVTFRLNTNANLILVNADSPELYRVCGDSVLINTRDDWHSKNPAVRGIMYRHDGNYYICTTKAYGKTSDFQLVEKIQAGDHTYYLYVWLNMPEVMDWACVSTNCIIFQSSSKFYRSQVTGNIPQELTELVLTRKPKTCMVDLKLAASANRRHNWFGYRSHESDIQINYRRGCNPLL